MAPATSASSTSLKEYLKKYEDKHDEENKKKKKKKEKKKEKKKKVKHDATGVIVVDEDPIWQKPVKLDEESEESDVEEKPQVDEDIEVKRMKRLELLREKRAIGAISEDGSGWVSISDAPKSVRGENSDISPPRKRRARNDTPSPEPGMKPSEAGVKEATHFSPPRKHHYSPSSEPKSKAVHSFAPDATYPGPGGQNHDISPPRQRGARFDSPSPPPRGSALKSSREVDDLSPLRRQRKRQYTPSPEPETDQLVFSAQKTDLPPPRRSHLRTSAQEEKNSLISDLPDISPPRQVRLGSPLCNDFRASAGEDLSPPRKGRKGSGFSPPRLKERSLPRQHPKTGLISGQDIKEDNARTMKDDWQRYKDMDPLVSGRGAQPVFRDKTTGKRISKEELEKKEKKEEKPKEIKLEWGKGLAQKREGEEKLLELELEKDKPFARTRDDPELDRMMKERVRWGDPMAHLVKRKHSEPILPDFGDDEKMKESGFIIPQDIPSHSWIRRGLDAAPNRYGIKPGRHWDGVDRSNGFEKESFKRVNERQATEREAYLWSVSDM